MKAELREHSGGLLLVTTGKREFTEDARARCTQAVQARCDKLWPAGSYMAEGYTLDALPAARAG